MLKTSVQQLQQILILKNRSSQLINVQRNLSYVRISQHHDINRVKYSNVYHQQQRTLFGWWGKSSTPKIETTQTTVTEPSQFEAPKIETVEPTIQIQTPEIVEEASGYIPELAPIPMDDVVLNSLGEATLRSLGLGSYWTPPGWVQLVNELIHVELDLPWYQAIIIYTLITRTLLLPLTIKIQKNAFKMKVISPRLSELQAKYTEAKASIDIQDQVKAAKELQTYMKANDIKLRNYAYPMFQVPVIASSFMGIKSMCNLPVDSMQSGGYWWFNDLTVVDPYCILPFISSATLFLILEKGLETGQSIETLSPAAKWAMRIMPQCFLLPYFVWWAPSGVMIYIISTNAYSLATALVLSIPSVKKYFGMPIMDEKTKELLRESKKNNKGVFEGLKDSMTQKSAEKQLEKNKASHTTNFQKAGLGAPIKTYKINPKEKTFK